MVKLHSKEKTRWLDTHHPFETLLVKNHLPFTCPYIISFLYTLYIYHIILDVVIHSTSTSFSVIGFAVMKSGNVREFSVDKSAEIYTVHQQF